MQGGYVRGEETRGRIIQAAVKVFGEVGYAAASTRQIAAEAGVVPPALQYYFDSKDGLHRACGEALAERVAARLSEPLEAARGVLKAGDAEAAREALCDLLESLLVQSVSAAAEPVGWRQFMARAQMEDAPGLEIVRAAIAPAFGACVGLVTCAIGKPEPDEEARLLAMLLVSQVTTFAAGREARFKALGWTAFGDSEVAAVKRALRRIVRGATAA